MECIICVEPFTKQKRKQITCEYCEFTSCKECFETYLLNESKPRCMNNDCGREWTPKFLSQNFPHTFINGEYKTHMSNVLFDKERALLPATQPLVENMILAEKISDEMAEEYKKIREIERRISSLRIRRNELLNKSVTKERSKFVRACPDGNCRGFLSSQWKCGICQQWTCHECHEIKGDERDCEHVCNEDAKATAALLNNDTKPCPQCGTGIFKIDGCDQMWCTDCHTAFSWRTGRIENNIHNPHYYEWMRRNNTEIPQNHNEVQCGREIDHYLVRSLESCLSSNIYLTPLRDFVRRLCREIIHIRFTVMDRYATDHVANNQDLRINYLRNEIDAEMFKNILQKNDKRDKKKREMYNIYVLYVNTVTDIIFRFYNNVKDIESRKAIQSQEHCIPLKIILNEVITIYDYANECFQTVAKTYKSTPHQIHLGTSIEAIQL